MPIDSALTKYGAFSPGVCTSTTRPTSPYQGQSIYESDTGSFLVYYGATTGWKPPWSQPWGRVGSYSGTSDLTYSAIGNTAISCTASMVQNRNYRFTFSSRLINTSASSNQFAFFLRRDGANVTYFDSPIIAGTLYHPMTYVGFFSSTSTGSSTFLINLAYIAQNGINFSGSIGPNFLFIEDIGPTTTTAPTS